MSVTPRVSIEQVREALVRQGGNMSATAQELGIARNNLYKRIVRSGLDLSAIRAAAPRRGKVEDTAEQMRPTAGSSILAVRARRGPVRVREPHQALLREAKFDLGAAFRVDTTEDLVLAQFIEERFSDWLREKLAHAPARGQ